MEFFWQKAWWAKDTRKFYFEPQTDITAYELAKLMPLIIPARGKSQKYLNKQVDALPENLRRHVREKK